MEITFAADVIRCIVDDVHSGKITADTGIGSIEKVLNEITGPQVQKENSSGKSKT